MVSTVGVHYCTVFAGSIAKVWMCFYSCRAIAFHPCLKMFLMLCFLSRYFTKIMGLLSHYLKGSNLSEVQYWYLSFFFLGHLPHPTPQIYIILLYYLYYQSNNQPIAVVELVYWKNNNTKQTVSLDCKM